MLFSHMHETIPLDSNFTYVLKFFSKRLDIISQKAFIPFSSIKMFSQLRRQESDNASVCQKQIKFIGQVTFSLIWLVFQLQCLEWNNLKKIVFNLNMHLTVHIQTSHTTYMKSAFYHFVNTIVINWQLITKVWFYTRRSHTFLIQLTPLSTSMSLKWSSVNSNSRLVLSKSLTNRQTSVSGVRSPCGRFLQIHKFNVRGMNEALNIQITINLQIMISNFSTP